MLVVVVSAAAAVHMDLRGAEFGLAVHVVVAVGIGKSSCC